MATFRENNMSVMYVRNMFAMYCGLPYECLSVADLTYLAKSGGVNLSSYTGRTGTEKAAFKITEAAQVEIPSNIAVGQLITGARPFWNIFSANSPGEWRKVGGSTVQGYFRHFLRTNAATAELNEYCAYLDGYSLHDLDATPPFVSDHLAINFIRTDSGIQTLTTYWGAGLGSYYFENKMGALPCKLGIALYKNGTTFLAQGTLSLSTFQHNSSTSQITINIPYGITITASDTILAKLYLQENNLSGNLDRFFIEETLSSATSVNIEDQRTPSFTQQSRFIRWNGTIIYTDSGQAQYIICTGTGLAIGNTSFQASITPKGFSSASNYYKHIFVHEWYDGVEQQSAYSHTVNNTAWNDNINYNLSVNFADIIKGGRSYFIRVIESTSSTPPLE